MLETICPNCNGVGLIAIPNGCFRALSLCVRCGGTGKILNVEGINMNKNNKSVREYNVGKSDYSKHKIQVWDIWLEYDLNPFDADIVKRVLRNKEGESRKTEYEKIIHICQERIRQIENDEITKK